MLVIKSAKIAANTFEFMSPNDCRLQTNRIDIWEFSLAALPTTHQNVLNQDERIRADRFYFPKHRRRFTVARTMLRYILARYLNTKPEILDFHYNKYGKPSLHDTNQIEFNLSHSGDLALLAVGQQFPLGIDLEYFSTRPYDELGRYSFSPEEYATLLTQPSPLKPWLFFHIWAQKEAFIKACGMGLTYPTQQFTVPTFPSADAIMFDPLHNKHWVIKSFMPKIACCAALCHNPSIHVIRKITSAMTYWTP